LNLYCHVKLSVRNGSRNDAFLLLYCHSHSAEVIVIIACESLLGGAYEIVDTTGLFYGRIFP